MLKIKSWTCMKSDLENDFVDVMARHNCMVIQSTTTNLLKVMNDNSVND